MSDAIDQKEVAILGDTRPVDVLDSPTASGLVIRGGALRVGSYLAATGLGFLATPLLARYLGVDDFGRYVTVGTLIATVGIIADAGLALVGIREYVLRDTGGRTRLLRNLVGLRVAISLLGVAAACVFAVLVGYSEQMVIGTLLAGIGLVFLMVQQVCTIPLLVVLRLGPVAAFDFAKSGLTVLGILLVILLGGGLVAFLAIPIPVMLVVLIATAALMHGRMSVKPAIEASEWRRLLQEALPIAIAATVGAFFFRSAILVMSIIATPEETGYFSASFRVVEAIIAVAGLIAASSLPILARAAHDDLDRLRYAMQRLFDVAVILGAWAAISVLVGANAIMRFIGGSEFEPAALTLRIQGAALACSFLIAVWAAGLWALRRQRALAVANLVGVSLTVGLTLVLVPEHGAVGAAIATTVVELVVVTMYATLLTRSDEGLRPALSTVPKVVVSAVPALAVWGLPVADVVKLVLATGVFFGLLLALRGIPLDVYDAIAERGRRSE